MKSTVVFSLLMGAQFVAFCSCLGEDGSARRYAELMRHDELLLTFCLLGRRDVQGELQLTAKQVATLNQARCAKDQDIPGMTELRANFRKRRSDPALPLQKKEKLGKAVLTEMTHLCEAYQRRQLSATLSAKQRLRLDELLTQMAGPLPILENPAISSRLQLSAKQRGEMADTVKHYEAGLGWLQTRYARQQIAGFSHHESRQDREKELEALFVVIRAAEKERDAALLMTLTPDQLASWQKLQGKPSPIVWPLTSFSDYDCE